MGGEKLSKEKLKRDIRELFRDEDVQGFSEYPQFAEETLEKLVHYLNTDGLNFLKNQLESIRDQERDFKEYRKNSC